MSRHPASGMPAPGRWLGPLISWLQAGFSETGRAAQDAQGDDAGPPSRPYGCARVLVVDDDPVNLMMMSALLESRGLVALLAADGAEAVALAGELRFDLVLMDLQMPILDGYGAVAAIRCFERAHSRAPVPIVAYSSTSPGLGVLAMHGMDGSLDKPCDDHDLEACLVRWCGGDHAASSLGGGATGRSDWQKACPAPDSRNIWL